MKKSAIFCALFSIIFSTVTLTGCTDTNTVNRWSQDKANEWYSKIPWMSGCDYIPATAINQIEMWSKDSYDAKEIDRELSWAQDLGFTTMRVFLSSVVYKT